MILSASRRIFNKTVLQGLYKKLNKISSTYFKIYIICIKKLVRNSQLIFSNVFTHHPVEIYFFLLLHLISLIPSLQNLQLLLLLLLLLFVL